MKKQKAIVTYTDGHQEELWLTSDEINAMIKRGDIDNIYTPSEEKI